MKKSFKRARFGVGAVAMALTVVGCGSTEGGDESESGGIPEVSISVTHPTDLYGLPWQVGIEKGLFEEAGIKIGEIIPGAGGGSTLRNILSGDLPYGEVATTAVLEGYLAGAPIKVIGGGVQSVNDIIYVSSADNNEITEIEDARGKKWGYSNPGSITEALSFMVPEAAGLSTGDVDRVATGGTGEGIALLEAGDIDVFYAPPRILLENEDKFKVLAKSSEVLPDFQQTVILANPQDLEENPDNARALLEGYAASVEWIAANPEEAGEIYTKLAEMSPEFGKEIVQDAVDNNYWGAAFNAAALEAAADGLVATGGSDEIPWSEAFTDEYLPEDHKGELPSE